MSIPPDIKTSQRTIARLGRDFERFLLQRAAVGNPQTDHLSYIAQSIFESMAHQPNTPHYDDTVNDIFVKDCIDKAVGLQEYPVLNHGKFCQRMTYVLPHKLYSASNEFPQYPENHRFFTYMDYQGAIFSARLIVWLFQQGVLYETMVALQQAFQKAKFPNFEFRISEAARLLRAQLMWAFHVADTELSQTELDTDTPFAWYAPIFCEVFLHHVQNKKTMEHLLVEAMLQSTEEKVVELGTSRQQYVETL